MSLILDALKKSEEERRRGEMPDLRTEHAASPPSRPRHLFWPALFAVALLINALLLLWRSPWQAPVPAPPAKTAPEAAIPIVPEPTSALNSPPHAAAVATADHDETDPESLAIGEPAGWSDLRREPPAPSPKPVAPRSPARTETGRTAGQPPSLPHLRNLPDAFRRALPDLTISLHYYDPDPASRIIRLNGRILREGSTVAEGLILEEITAAGVILNWQGERFRAGDF